MEGSVIIWTAFITAFGALILGVYTTWTGRRKPDAEADAITSSEWRKLYDEMCRRIEKLEEKAQRQDDEIRQQARKLDRQDNKIKRLTNQLDIAKQYIQYFWAGTVANLKYMREQGLDKPPFEPDRSFRGENEFDDLGWDWLDNQE